MAGLENWVSTQHLLNDKLTRNACTEIERVKRPKNEVKLLLCPFAVCLKEFTETGNLKTHMRTHTGERPFTCNQCQQQFITKGHLQAHELTHTGLKPFVCSYPGCNKRYSRAGRLKIHSRLHVSLLFHSPPHALLYIRLSNWALICSFIFVLFRLCDRHASSRRGAVLLACAARGRPLSLVLTHRCVQTGERPYKCPMNECDKSFREKGNLVTHLRSHSRHSHSASHCGSKLSRSATMNEGSSMHLVALEGGRAPPQSKGRFGESGAGPNSLKGLQGGGPPHASMKRWHTQASGRTPHAASSDEYQHGRGVPSRLYWLPHPPVSAPPGYHFQMPSFPN